MSRALRPLIAFLIAIPTIAAGQQQPALAGTAVVAGQVIDAANKPVGGATVTLMAGALAVATVPGQPPARPPARFAIAVANAQGRFVFRDVPAGEYSLTAELAGYAPGASGRRRISGPSRTFTVANGARLIGANVTMWKLGAISGFVRNDRGEPAVGVGVWAMRRMLVGGRWELSFAGGAVEATDERGHYRLSFLTPGSYVIVVRSIIQNLSTQSADVYYAARAAGDQSMMGSEFVQTGAIRFPGSGLAVGDWQVAVSNSAPPVLPGPNGTILTYPTVFHPNAGTAAEATVVAIAPGDDRTGIDLTLTLVPGVRVAGTLLGPEGPAPSHGLKLVRVSTSPDDAFFDSPTGNTATDAAGRFQFNGVPPGNYIVKAYRVPGVMMGRPGPPPPPGTVPPAGASSAPSLFAETPVTVGSVPIDGLSLTLQPGARLAGRVRFEGSVTPPAFAQLPRMLIQIRPLNLTGPPSTVTIDQDGRLTSSGLAPGRYTLNVGVPGAPWSLATARVGDVDAAGQAFSVGASDIGDVDIVFTDKVTTLSGTVRSSTAGGSSDGMVVIYPADVQGWISSGMSPRRVVAAPTSPNGDYRLFVLVPGDYLIVAIPPDVAPEVDADFAKKYGGSAVRVTFALGDTKVQSLVMR